MFKKWMLAAVLGLAMMVPVALAEDSSLFDPITYKQSMDGLLSKDEVIGVGEPAKSGNTVSVHYIGVLFPSMQKFDSSRDRNEPFSFKLGARQVIPGWEKGVLGMQAGGKRLLIIPPNLAYGKGGAGNAIPPNATLLFEVEVLSISGEASSSSSSRRKRR